MRLTAQAKCLLVVLTKAGREAGATGGRTAAGWLVARTHLVSPYETREISVCRPAAELPWRQAEMSRSEVRVSVKTTGDPRIGSPV